MVLPADSGAGIVHFSGPNGEAGAGFFLDDNVVCTCTHVVAAVLGLSADDPEAPGDEIEFSLPWLEAAARGDIIEWIPRSRGDLTLIRVTSPVPDGIRPFRLLGSPATAGRRFRAVGFPRGYGHGGAWATGVIGHPRGDGTVQLQVDEAGGTVITGGFSGSPVMDARSALVCGIVVQADADPRVPVAVMQPASRLSLLRAWSPPNSEGPVSRLLDGLAGVAGGSVDRVESFLAEYLGTEEQPAPFGGRASALASLSEWADDDLASPCALLAATAGRGKSALLARWAVDLVDEDRADVAFVPVSARFGTASFAAAVSVLGARLRHLDGGAGDPPSDVSEWSSEISVSMRRDRPASRPLVVIVDGADEAADWVMGRDFRFPPTLGRNVRVLVSGRAVPGKDVGGWAAALGWVSPTLLPLPPLDRNGVIQALVSIGTDLRSTTQDDAVIDELVRLTEGDPLMVRLWCEALRGELQGGRPVLLQTLTAIEPGLASYLDRWWAECEATWRREGLDAVACRERLSQFFRMLGTACGPVLRDEARTLGADFWTGPELSAVARDATRFVVGDGRNQGWAIAHPRLGDHFLQDDMTPVERAAWRSRYLALGRQTAGQLRSGAQLDEVETYSLRHFGEHLRLAHEPHDIRRCQCADDLDALIHESWQAAQEYVDGTSETFRHDLHVAVEVNSASLVAAYGARRDLDAISRQLVRCIRYALVESSLRSQTDRLPAAMVLALTAHQVWTGAQAVASVSSRPEYEIPGLLNGIVRLHPELSREAMRLAMSIDDQAIRLAARACVASADPAQAPGTWTAVFRERVDSTEARDAMIWVSSYLTEDQFQDLVSEAKDVREPAARAGLMTAIAITRAEPARTETLRAAAAILDHLTDSELSDAASHAPDLIPFLTDATRDRVLRMAIESFDSWDAGSESSWHLVSWIRNADETHRRQIVDRLLDGMDADTADLPWVAWSDILEGASRDQLVRIAAVARRPPSAANELSHDDNAAVKAAVLAATGSRLGRVDGASLLSEARSMLAEIDSELSLRRGLEIVSSALSDPLFASFETLVAKLDPVEQLRVKATRPAFRQTTPLPEILRILTAVPVDFMAADLLGDLIVQFSDEELGLTMATIMDLEPEPRASFAYFWLDVIRSIAGRKDNPGTSTQLAERAIGAIAMIPREFRRDAQETLAPALGPGQIRALLAESRFIRDNGERARLFAKLARYASRHDRSSLAQLSFDVDPAASGGSDYERVTDLVHALTDEELLQLASRLTAIPSIVDLMASLAHAYGRPGLAASLIQLTHADLDVVGLTKLALSERDGSSTLGQKFLQAVGDATDGEILRLMPLDDIDLEGDVGRAVLGRLLALACPEDPDSALVWYTTVQAHLTDDRRELERRRLVQRVLADPSGMDAVRRLVSAANLVEDPERSALVARAWETVRTIRSGFDTASAIDRLAPLLPDELWPDALDRIGRIQDEHARSSAIKPVALHIPDGLLGQVLDLVNVIQTDGWRARASGGVGQRHLRDGRFDEALALLEANADSIFASEGWMDEAESLPLHAVERAIELLEGVPISSEYTLGALYCRLMQLDPTQVRNCLEKASKLTSDVPRGRVLAAFTDSEVCSLVDVADEIAVLLRQLAMEDRARLVTDLGSLAPALVHTAGVGVVPSVAAEIQQVAGWYR